MIRIAMIVAPQNFREPELEIPHEFFTKKKGASVEIVSTTKTAKGASGSTVNVDRMLDEVDAGEYDAIVFIGGPGTPILRAEKKAIEIARKSHSLGKVVAGICWSTTILAKAGILDGKKATVWFGNDAEYGMTTAQFLESKGAEYVNKGVVVDGKVVTADGPAHAREYAEAVWNAIQSKD